MIETLVRCGELFGADSMVPVTSQYNHLVTSFGLKALGPVYALMDKLIAQGTASRQKFSADPRPVDKNVPSSFLQNFVFGHTHRLLGRRRGGAGRRVAGGRAHLHAGSGQSGGGLPELRTG